MNSSNSRIARNTLFLYIRMFFIMIVSLYTSRVVLNVLGAMDYGIYCVVGAFVSLFSFLNATLSASMQRFYNYEIGETGGENLSEIYSDGLSIHFVLGGILFVLLETVGLWYLNNIMVIPQERMLAANVLYQFTIISSVLVLFQIPYIGAVMAYEKMDFYAFVSILDTVLKLVVVIILPYLSFDKIIVYGFLLLAISIFDFLCYFSYSKVKFKGLVYTRNRSHRFLKEILSFSGWNMIGTLMFMIKAQVLSLLLNFFFNPIVNAARGLAIQVSGAVNNFSSNVSVAFRPQLTNSYAEGDYPKVVNLMFSESKICFFLILLLMTPLAIEIDYVLNLWLGDAIPENTSFFILLTLIDVLICTLNTPCTQVVLAVGNIKWYQIAATIVNFTIMPVAWLLLHLGFEPYSVFVLTIIFSIINQIVCIIITQHIFPQFSMKSYLSSIILPCTIATVLLPLIPLLLGHLLEQGWLRLLVVCSTTVITGVIVFFFIVLNSDERGKVKGCIYSKLKQ